MVLRLYDLLLAIGTLEPRPELTEGLEEAASDISKIGKSMINIV
jgi:hypothetical protein